MSLTLEPTTIPPLHFAPNVSTEAWYYQERDGITIVIEVRDKGGAYLGTTQHCISLSRIRRYISAQSGGETPE